MADEKQCLTTLIEELKTDLDGEIREELLAMAKGNHQKALFLAKSEVNAKTRALRKILNDKAKDELRQYLKLSPGNMADGLRAFVEGTKTSRERGKLSISNHMEVTRSYVRAQFLNELRQKELLKILGDGDFDDEIRRAVGALDSKGVPDLKGIPQEAIEIAQIYIKHNENLRQALNKTGESIAKKPGYFGGRSYDGKKMQADGKDMFTENMMNWVDWEKVAPDLKPKGRVELLGRFWEAKVHGRNMTFKSADGVIRFGPGKHSNATVFILKDFDAELELQAAYGNGKTLYEQWDFEFYEKARTLGIQERGGPNAETNIDAVVGEAVEQLDRDGRGADATALNKEWDRLRAKEWRGITGDINIPVNAMGASVGGKVRTWNGMTSLGSSLLSQMGDVAAVASTMKYYGVGGSSDFPMYGVYKAVEGGMGGFKKLTREQQDFASGVGLMLESMAYSPSRFDVDIREPGNQSRFVSRVFKTFGVQQWQDGNEFAVIRRASNKYAGLVDRSFDQLPKDIARVFPQYGIGEREWDIWRKAGQRS